MIIKNLIEMTNETLVNSYANAITWEKCQAWIPLIKKKYGDRIENITLHWTR